MTYEFPFKVSCEFVCYSIHHMVNLLFLFSIIHEVEYYLDISNFAFIFSIFTPILIALIIYIIFLWKNGGVSKIVFVLLPIFAYMIYKMYDCANKEIEYIDNYTSTSILNHAFFCNYFYYLFGLVSLWIFLYYIQKYFVKFGIRKAVSKSKNK